MMTDLMRSGTGQPQFLAGKWRQKNPRTYLCQAHAGIYDYSAFSFLVLALIPDCSALRALTILKNIHNPLIFLTKNGCLFMFVRESKRKNPLQASLRWILDLLTLVSLYIICRKITTYVA